MAFVDTNIFIRFIVADDLHKAQKCLNLLEQAEKGKLSLYTTESVIAETVYILSSKKLYALSSSLICEKLSSLLKIRNLHVPQKSVVIHALQIYSNYKLDFEDALLISHALKAKNTKIYSYYHEFDQVNSITRLEP